MTVEKGKVEKVLVRDVGQVEVRKSGGQVHELSVRRCVPVDAIARQKELSVYVRLCILGLIWKLLCCHPAGVLQSTKTPESRKCQNILL